MSEGGFAVLLMVSVLALCWLIVGALRTGETIGRYFTDSSRSGNPFLFWFDISISSLIAAVGFICATVALWRL